LPPSFVVLPSTGRTCIIVIVLKKDYNWDKVDEVVLALLSLNFWTDGDIIRAWKGFDWEALDRLHQKGYISDPRSKAKSVVMTEKGERRALELFEKLFGKPP
jgi:Domain of unknown function (DUF6429)